ncbi:MAG: NmrA family NAD(P)-binding protein [Pseudomonadota bacterium]
MQVLLTAANGRTGRAILAALVATGTAVKVFIRDASQWPELEALGAHSHAVGDMQDKASIDKAVTGCDTVIHIGPPMHPNEVEITERIVSAALSGGVERFVYYSVMHPLRREVRHHRLKLDAEENLIESGIPYTIVQPSRYMQHLVPIWKQVVRNGIHSMPFSIEKRFNVVDLRDLADATAAVATQDGHEYATYELAGPQALSQKDMAATIADILGQPVKAVALDLDTMEQKARAAGASDDRIEQMLTMNRHYDAHGFLGNANVLHWLLRREPTTFRAYVEWLASQ